MSETPTTVLPDSAPTVRFADFGLAPEILRALTDQGYIHPTPIQAEAIPIVLQGRDVMGAAQTGTGKTAGFSLPIIQLLLAHANPSMSPARHPVRALVLTPTRELAVQVAENVKAYARHTPLRSTVVFGGMDMKPQTAILRNGVEIVIDRGDGLDLELLFGDHFVEDEIEIVRAACFNKQPFFVVVDACLDGVFVCK